MKKIPLTVWTILIISLVALLIYSNDLTTSESNKIGIAANIVTIIGVFFVALQINKQSRESVISTEFLNQPNFEFIGVFKDKLIGSSPNYCSEANNINYNNCNDLHWFDFKQIGNLPAKKVRISLIHEDESKNILKLLKKRTMEFEMVYQDDRHQFKLSPELIPISLFDTKSNGNFLILLDYVSVYSKIRYKRIYKLNYAPKVTPNSKVTDWKDSIRYFDLVLLNLEDSLSINWNSFLENKWNRIMLWSKIKKKVNTKKWLSDL
jgi:hypothetical protein